MKVESPILKQLGPVPFWRGEGRCVDGLARIYRLAMEKAQSRATAKCTAKEKKSGQD